MRIIHVSTKKHHPAYSDVVFLQAKKHDVIFIILDPCDDPQYNITSRYNEDGVTYVHLNVRDDFDFAFDPKLELAFYKILKEFNPDIIHVQLFSGVNVLSILRASSGSLAKKIITLHIHSLFCLSGACFDKGQVCSLNSMEECSCEYCQSEARREKLSLLKYNQNRKARCEEIVSLADVIICCSHWQKDAIRHLLGETGKTVVLHHGFDRPQKYEHKATVTRSEIEEAGINWKSFVRKVTQHGFGKQTNATTIRFLKSSDREKDKPQTVLGNDFKKLLSILEKPIKRIRKKSSPPTFGYLGSLWELKGIDILLNSIQQLRPLKFQVFMGIKFEPTEAKDVAQVKKLKEHPLIRVMPNLTRKDLYKKFFSQIDYLIIPSVWEETGPMTLFESFFYKIPVIISDRSSMVEKTKEGVNSLVFDNANTLAEIMKNIIEGRVSLGVKTQKNFPVKTFKEYATILEGIYSGKTKSVNNNSFTLNVGSLCNNNCIFCVRGTNDAIRKVDFDVLRNMLEKYSGQYGRLKITGGEPTLRKDLVSILEVADHLGYKNILIETNARMFAHAKLARLIMSYGPKIVAHLESYTPLIHDRINRKKGSFIETVAGIRNVLKCGGTVAVKIMIVKDNYPDLLMISKFIAKLGVDQIIFVFIDPGGYADKSFNIVVPRYSEVRPYVENAVTWLMKNKKIKITLEDFPFCCIDPMFRGFESKRLKKTNVKALSYSPRPEKATMYEPLFERRKRKEKSPKCRLCKFDTVCEGIYKRYSHHFGWQEFRPISTGKKESSHSLQKRIDLKTGFLCHNNCRFCVQAHKKKFGNKKTEELKKSLFQSAKEGYKAVVFTGGETTIRPDVIDLVKYAKKMGFGIIQMQSNGRRFADIDFCKKIIAAGATEFAPALHGPNPKIHDYLTRAKGSFIQTVKGIRNLKKLQQLVITNTVITKTNYRYLPEIAMLLIQLRVNQFQLAFVHALGNAGKNFDSVVPRKLLVVPYVKKALDLGIYAGVSVRTEAIPYCFMAGYENYVVEDKIPDTKIIDLYNVVENFNETRRAEAKIKADKCQECKYFEKCEGPWKEYPEHFGWNEFKPVK